MCPGRSAGKVSGTTPFVLGDLKQGRLGTEFSDQIEPGILLCKWKETQNCSVFSVTVCMAARWVVQFPMCFFGQAGWKIFFSNGWGYTLISMTNSSTKTCFKAGKVFACYWIKATFPPISLARVTGFADYRVWCHLLCSSERVVLYNFLDVLARISGQVTLGASISNRQGNDLNPLPGQGRAGSRAGRSLYLRT